MASNTDIELRKGIIYSAFIRNHTKEGTFRSFEKDLDRIKALGTDIIWLLPIHPIGEKTRKGKEGSPYAISDFRTVNPEFGTFKDFSHLVDEIHNRGMKCIIDVVYNHTSKDSVLLKEHPEFFHWDDKGDIITMIPEWDDIVDLNYENKELWEYLFTTLEQWAGIVDGFRCDVAPKVPIDFWIQARKRVEGINPSAFWLAESADPLFVKQIRNYGQPCSSDSELYQAFDICYDYDIRGIFMEYLEGRLNASIYARLLMMQEGTYPENYIKLRFLENHDQPRISELIKNESNVYNWTAFMYLLNGSVLIYEGQECMSNHRPSIFDKDDIEWNHNHAMNQFLIKMGNIKKENISTGAILNLYGDDDSDIFVIEQKSKDRKLTAVLSLKGKDGYVKVSLPNGIYKNLIDGQIVKVEYNKIYCQGLPIIITEKIL
ncbi:MAG TPA: alpha-amylase [Eubacteriaceae bacterium]|nr:alpha-amylase [Eubacteriaceae bacterium]